MEPLESGWEAGMRTACEEQNRACDWSASLSSELLQEIARRAGVSNWGALRCVCQSWRRGISLAVHTVRLTVPDRSTTFPINLLGAGTAAQPDTAQRPARKAAGAGRPLGGRAAATPNPEQQRGAELVGIGADAGSEGAAAATGAAAGAAAAASPACCAAPALKSGPAQLHHPTSSPQQAGCRQPDLVTRCGASSGRPPPLQPHTQPHPHPRSSPHLYGGLPDASAAGAAERVGQPGAAGTAGPSSEPVTGDHQSSGGGQIRQTQPGAWLSPIEALDWPLTACGFNPHYHPSVAVAAAAAAAARLQHQQQPRQHPGETRSDSHAAGVASSVGSSSIVVWNFLEAADKLAAAYPAFLSLNLNFAEPLPLCSSTGGSEAGSSRWLQMEITAALQQLLSSRLVSLALSGHTPYPLLLAPPPSLLPPPQASHPQQLPHGAPQHRLQRASSCAVHTAAPAAPAASPQPGSQRPVDTAPAAGAGSVPPLPAAAAGAAAMATQADGSGEANGTGAKAGGHADAPGPWLAGHQRQQRRASPLERRQPQSPTSLPPPPPPLLQQRELPLPPPARWQLPNTLDGDPPGPATQLTTVSDALDDMDVDNPAADTPGDKQAVEPNCHTASGADLAAQSHRGRWRDRSEVPSTAAIAAMSDPDGPDPALAAVLLPHATMTPASGHLRAAAAGASAALEACLGQKGSSGSAPPRGSPGLRVNDGGAEPQSHQRAAAAGSPGEAQASHLHHQRQSALNNGCGQLDCLSDPRATTAAAAVKTQGSAGSAGSGRVSGTDEKGGGGSGSGSGSGSGRESGTAAVVRDAKRYGNDCGGSGVRSDPSAAEGGDAAVPMDLDERPDVALTGLTEANGSCADQRENTDGSGTHAGAGVHDGLHCAIAEASGEDSARLIAATAVTGAPKTMERLARRLTPHHQQHPAPHSSCEARAEGSNGGGGNEGDGGGRGAAGAGVRRQGAASPDGAAAEADDGGGGSSDGQGSPRGGADGSGCTARPAGSGMAAAGTGSGGGGAAGPEPKQLVCASGGNAHSRSQTSRGGKESATAAATAAVDAAAAAETAAVMDDAARDGHADATAVASAAAGRQRARHRASAAAAAAAGAAAYSGQPLSSFNATGAIPAPATAATTAAIAAVAAAAAAAAAGSAPWEPQALATAAAAAASGASGVVAPPLLSRLSHLRSLTLVGDLGFPSPQHLEALTGLQELQTLDMRGAKFMQIDGGSALLHRHAWDHVGNEHVAVLSRCTSLVSLAINHVHSVCGRQLVALTALSRLTALGLTDALSGNAVYGAHLQALAEGLPGLRTLEVGRVTCPAMTFMQPLPTAAAVAGLHTGAAAAGVAATAAAAAAADTFCAGPTGAGGAAERGRVRGPPQLASGGAPSGGAGAAATAAMAAAAAVDGNQAWQPWGPVLGSFQGLTSLHLQVACSFETELLSGVAALPLLEALSLELLDVPPPQLAAMLQVLSSGDAGVGAGAWGGGAGRHRHAGGASGSTGGTALSDDDDTGSPVPYRQGRGRRRRDGPGGAAAVIGTSAAPGHRHVAGGGDAGGRGLSRILHGLTLTACMLYDEHLLLMGRLNHLRSIRLDQVDVRTRDPDGWTALSSVRGLEVFTFREWNNPVLSAGNLCVLTNDSLAIMAANWPRLQQLTYCGKVALTEKAEEHLAHMARLTSADIAGTDGTSCRVWRSAATGELLRTIALPYTAAKVSSRNGYVTYSDSDDSDNSEGSEASVNWMGEVGYVTSEYDAD